MVETLKELIDAIINGEEKIELANDVDCKSDFPPCLNYSGLINGAGHWLYNLPAKVCFENFAGRLVNVNLHGQFDRFIYNLTGIVRNVVLAGYCNNFVMLNDGKIKLVKLDGIRLRDSFVSANYGTIYGVKGMVVAVNSSALVELNNGLISNVDLLCNKMVLCRCNSGIIKVARLRHEN